MMKKVLILFLLIFTLYGCTFTQDKLDTPTNLRYEKFTLYFDDVDHADSYVIDFGDYTVNFDENFYEFYDFGDYEVRVKAKADGYQDSNYTEKLNISVVADFPTPTNLNLMNQILFWDPVPNADYYRISVDTQIYGTHDTNLFISLNDTLRKEIKVKAIFKLGESAYSQSIFASKEMTVLSSIAKNYSKQSTFNLDTLTFNNNAEVISAIDIMGQQVELSNFLVVDQTIFFKSSFLSTLPEGNNVFLLETNFGKHEVKINILNTNKPYMITGSNFKTNFLEDIVLTYELFGGEILSLSGNEITENDYNVSGNTVTINKEYVLEQFYKVTGRTTLILGYTLASGDNVVIGYIFISSNN